jgi:hypothetical protein
VAVANVVGDVELDPTLVGGVTVLSVDPLTKALTKVPSAPFATGRPLSAMASSPTAGLLATANGIDGTASVLAIDVSTGALNEVPGSPFSVPQRPYALAFSLHGGLLATANGGSPEGPSLSLFSVDNATGALTGVSISPLAASPRALTFSPNGKLLATGSPHDGYVSVFAVNSTGPPSTIATLSGRVTADGSAAAGALVQVCRVGAGSCQLRSTGLDGRYSVSVLDGSYQLTAFPPQDSSRAEGFAGPVTVHGADVTQDLALGPNPTPPPTNTTVSGFGTTPDGVPVVSWLLPFTLTTHGCGGGSASYEVRVEASVVRSGRLAEVSAGTYSVTVAELYPSRGQGAIHISIVCPDPAQNRTIDFSIYIDPSGRVTNSLGAPVRGATVVLLRSETPDGPFATVPNGSALMSPANRTNPDQSRVDGLFGWDVVAGYYKVRASKPSCVSMADHSASFTESPVLKIPPPVTDLVLRLYCGERPAGPRISDLRMRPSPFRVAGARNTARTTRRHASGSRIRFKLSARANVSFTFAVRTMGRRAGSACVKRTTSNRTRKPCVRYVAKGVLKRRAVASGATSIRFSGRIHARRLAPGRYRLAARPKSAAGVKGKQATASFRIVRR